MYSGSNKIAIIALCPYALLWNPRSYQMLNWTCCGCSRSSLCLDHAIQGSNVIALYNVHAIFKWFTVVLPEEAKFPDENPAGVILRRDKSSCFAAIKHQIEAGKSFRVWRHQWYVRSMTSSVGFPHCNVTSTLQTLISSYAIISFIVPQYVPFAEEIERWLQSGWQASPTSGINLHEKFNTRVMQIVIFTWQLHCSLAWLVIFAQFTVFSDRLSQNNATEFIPETSYGALNHSKSTPRLHFVYR